MANQPIPGLSNPRPAPDGYVPGPPSGPSPEQIREQQRVMAEALQHFQRGHATATPMRPTLMQTLDNDAREALKLTAAMQFPKRVVDLAAPVITAFAKNAGGKAGVLKAKAIIALLRSDTGQMILMGVAGIGLVYLPTGSARREYVKREIAPRMRQLAMGKGLDKLIDEILGPVMAAIDEVGTQLMAAMPAEALPEGFESGLRVDPAATAAPEEAPVAASAPAPAIQRA